MVGKTCNCGLVLDPFCIPLPHIFRIRPHPFRWAFFFVWVFGYSRSHHTRGQGTRTPIQLFVGYSSWNTPDRAPQSSHDDGTLKKLPKRRPDHHRGMMRFFIFLSNLFRLNFIQAFNNACEILCSIQRRHPRPRLLLEECKFSGAMVEKKKKSLRIAHDRFG